MSLESQPATLTDLQRWFSNERMDTYVRSAQATGCDVPELYVWNGQVSKALLEDIAHVEVLLRNFISVRLAKASGRKDWYKDEAKFRFNSSKTKRFEYSITDIERQIRHSGKPITPGRVIADMSLGSWCFLLSSRLEQTVWKSLRDPANGGIPHYPARKRDIFECHVRMMRDLRNRLSHREHIVLDTLADEDQYLDDHFANLDWIARAIDPMAADWIRDQSRVPAVRRLRPHSSLSNL